MNWQGEQMANKTPQLASSQVPKQGEDGGRMVRPEEIAALSDPNPFQLTVGNYFPVDFFLSVPEMQ